MANCPCAEMLPWPFTILAGVMVGAVLGLLLAVVLSLLRLVISEARRG